MEVKGNRTKKEDNCGFEWYIKTQKIKSFIKWVDSNYEYKLN